MPHKLKLLIIEDEAPIRAGLIDVFVYHGYEAAGAADGEEGLRMALTGDYALIVLDIMLPRLDGFSVCNRIREVCLDQPIIMLTAKSREEDIIAGLTLGADDYVSKPFSVETRTVDIHIAKLRRKIEADPKKPRFLVTLRDEGYRLLPSPI